MTMWIPEPILDQKDEEKGYLPILKTGSVIPFGYKEDPDNPEVLLPVVIELDYLAQAKKYRKQGHYTYEELAAWLTTRTGRQISKMGLRHRLRQSAKKRRAFIQYERYIRAAKEAAEKAKKIEERFLGRTYEEVYPGKPATYSKCTCGAKAQIPPKKSSYLSTQPGTTD